MRFYFRNAAIAEGEAGLFCDLEIGNGDKIYAIENGKA